MNSFVNFVQKNIIALDKKFARSFNLPGLVTPDVCPHLRRRLINGDKIFIGMCTTVFYTACEKERDDNRLVSLRVEVKNLIMAVRFQIDIDAPLTVASNNYFFR